MLNEICLTQSANACTVYTVHIVHNNSTIHTNVNKTNPNLTLIDFTPLNLINAMNCVLYVHKRCGRRLSYANSVQQISKIVLCYKSTECYGYVIQISFWGTPNTQIADCGFQLRMNA